ncbi:MAG TPA: cytochrome P450 [Pyrinomonadaceae bacterium]|nr:cytochrome P450 [Pyrinomonadaceae bacterium]
MSPADAFQKSFVTHDSSPASATRGVVWDETSSLWRVQGQAAAHTALIDDHLDVVRDVPADVKLPDDYVPSAMEFLGSWFSRSPRERHRAVKRHLIKPYHEQSIAPLEQTFEEVANDCATALSNECDLINDFLKPFWIRSTAHMLAVPEDQHENLAKVVAALSAILERPQLDDNATRVTHNCLRYLRALVETLFRLESPPPVVNALRELSEDQQVGGMWSAVSALAQLLTAGLQPTITGVAMTWRTLHAEPGLRNDVKNGDADPSDIVDEVLRLHPPFPFLHRWVQQRCECHGVVLEPGAHVLIDLRAANRDPAAFVDPDQFVPGRKDKLDLSFGHGPHRCPGAALARLQTRIVLRTLLAQQPPLVPVSVEAEPGTVREGHLVTVKSLACRRVSNQ